MVVSGQRRSVGIIGAGSVGSSLAVLFRRSGYRIISVISRRRSSAQKLARLVKCAHHSDDVADLPSSAGLVVIAVPDERILEIAAKLACRTDLQFRTLIVFHTSGALTSDVLLPLQRKGAKTFSLHPIQTFPARAHLADQLARMKGITYGFEGQTGTMRYARHLVKDVGGAMIRISKEKKILYHIACVVASNYSVALLGMVEELLALVGGDVRMRDLLPLLETSIGNAFRLTPGKALTGPIARGSVATIECHVRELLRTDKRLAGLYCQYGKQALRLALQERKIPYSVARKIEDILALE